MDLIVRVLVGVSFIMLSFDITQSSPLSISLPHFIEQLFLVSVHINYDAGRSTKFAPGKSLRFSKLILGILLFKFRFTVFFPLGCEVDS